MALLISKALGLDRSLVKKGSRGSLGSYIVNAPHQYGQPYSATVGAGDQWGVISPERMREIVLKTSTAGSVVNTVLDFATGVDFSVRSVDARLKPDPKRSHLMMDLLMVPNPEDTALEFRQMIMRDILTTGFAAAQIERDTMTGKVAALWPLDAGKFWVDFDEHGNILGYNMLDAHGQPIKGPDSVHAWLDHEIIFFRRDPFTKSRYPMSRITQLFTLALLEDMMIYFISGKFTDSNVPYGVFDLGDIAPDDLMRAVDMWNTQFESGHRIMLVNSKEGSKWFPFGYHLKDLEAKELLEIIRRKQMEVVGVTDNEMGESQNVNKSNGYSLSFTFKKRAVEPLLNTYYGTLTRFLAWEVLGFRDLEYGFDEIDTRDELLQAQIDDLQLRHGAITINHVINRRGDPSVPGGDEPNLFTGSAWIPVSMVNSFAQAQLEALQAESRLLTVQALLAEQGGTNPPKAGVSAPMIRAAAEPERFTTPDGAGGSNLKVTLPKPSAPQQSESPRGGVQALRQQGVRKEDS